VTSRPATPDLEIREVTVRFGGLVAVDHVSLLARGGAITGLIGPNGAGKTTTFNATTGTVTTAGGSITLDDEVIDRLSPTARAQRGLGRTFQRMELFDTMTVAENVALGPELLAAGRRPWHHLVASRRERTETAERTDEALDRCGITALAGRSTGALSTGQRRLVELARAIATPFRFLLLDEPSSGLDVHETERFAAILRGVVADRGTGLLLVEHDMALVRSICDFAYVLDFGRLIFEGPTDEVLRSDIVRAAYLGSDADERAGV
jgi:ABC-type branched-subunit amino acid transport system ATPase component